MSGKGRKKAVTNTTSDPSHGPDGASLCGGDEVAKTVSPPDPTPRVQALQQVLYACGRFYHAMTAWLTHESKLIQALGVITWLVVLGTFSAGIVLILLKWEPWAMVAAIVGFTGVTAVVNKRGSTGGSD